MSPQDAVQRKRQREFAIGIMRDLSAHFNNQGIGFESENPMDSEEAQEFIIRLIINRKGLVTNVNEENEIVGLILKEAPVEDPLLREEQIKKISKNQMLVTAFKKVGAEIARMSELLITRHRLEENIHLNNIVRNSVMKLLGRIVQIVPRTQMPEVRRENFESMRKRINEVQTCLDYWKNCKRTPEDLQFLTEYCRFTGLVHAETKPQQIINILRTNRVAAGTKLSRMLKDVRLRAVQEARNGLRKIKSPRRH